MTPERRSPLGVAAWTMGNLVLILSATFVIAVVFTRLTEARNRELTVGQTIASAFWFAMIVILLGAVLYLAVLWLVLRVRRPERPRATALRLSPLVALPLWVSAMVSSDARLLTVVFGAVLSLAAGLIVRLPATR